MNRKLHLLITIEYTTGPLYSEFVVPLTLANSLVNYRLLHPCLIVTMSCLVDAIPWEALISWLSLAIGLTAALITVIVCYHYLPTMSDIQGLL